MKLAQKIEERFFKVLMILATYFILLVLAIIIYSIFEKGLRSISWEMLTQIPHGGYYYGKGEVSSTPSWALWLWLPAQPFWHFSSDCRLHSISTSS